MLPTTMRRNEQLYGDCVRDAVDVIAYEMEELGNLDIPETVYNRYILPNFDVLNPLFPEAINLIKILLDSDRDIENDRIYLRTHNDYEQLAIAIIDMINRISHSNIRYVLWLATKENVIKHYSGNESNMTEYPTSPIILSDLGEEGYLFGFENCPKKQGGQNVS